MIAAEERQTSFAPYGSDLELMGARASGPPITRIDEERLPESTKNHLRARCPRSHELALFEF